jgi:probable rRNA maturation factor
MSRRIAAGRPPRGRRRPTVDIVVASPLWKARRHAKAVLRRAIAEAAEMVSAVGGEVAVVLTDDSAIRALNRNWRRKDAATNVLSFPAKADVPPPARRERPAKLSAPPCLLGDIVIAFETVEREARAEAKPFEHHLAHLTVHGFLHLLGYDHAETAAAEAMEGLETAILARLDVPDPYLARAGVDS